MQQEITREQLDALSKKLADEGKIIAAGFVGMRMALIPLNAPQAQVDDMERAYLSGAQHLWSSMMSIMDPDAEPTEADMRRMDLIDKELRAAAERLKRHVYGQGH